MRATLFVVLLAVFAVSCADSSPPLPPEVLSEPRRFDGPAATVHFKSLRAYLPDELPGYQRLREDGSTGKYGELQVSEAQREFALSDGRKLLVRIVDSSISKTVGQRITAAVAEAMRKGAGDPDFPIVLSEAIGVVRYDDKEERAEANLWVGNRYLVAITSQGFAGTTEVRSVATALNVAGLSKLR